MPEIPLALDDDYGPDLAFGAERGLFFADASADRRSASGTKTPPRGPEKNEDFLRLKDAALRLLGPAAGMRVLDIGCANGAQMVMCALLGAESHGVDTDAPSVEYANRKFGRLDLSATAVVADAEALPYPDDYFDAALSSDFHEHIDDSLAVRVNREVMRVLRPGGRFVVKTPNVDYLRSALAFKRVRALAAGQDPRGYVIPHSPGTADAQHIGLRNRAGLADTFAAAGFQDWCFHYSALRRFGRRRLVDVLSTEVPCVRDHLSEDLLAVTWKPISMAFFPN